jgi:hypothetical protein
MVSTAQVTPRRPIAWRALLAGRHASQPSDALPHHTFAIVLADAPRS